MVAHVLAASLVFAACVPAPVIARVEDRVSDYPEARLGDWNDRVRLVVETHRRLPWQTYTARHADTLIVPFEGVDALDLRRALKRAIPSNHALIVRHDIVTGASPRLVLHLRRPARVELFVLRPMEGHAHRLVLDMFPLAAEQKTPPAHVAQPGIIHERSPDAVQAGKTQHYSAVPEELWLVARVNQQDDARAVLAVKTGSTLWLSRTDLERWNINPPPSTPGTWFGDEYLDVEQVGITADLDTRRMTLALTVPAGMFHRTRLATRSEALLAPAPVSSGAFLNYDISALHDTVDDRLQRNAFFELGAFNGWGSGAGSFIARDRTDARRELIRLDTSWRKDDPSTMRSVVIGDSISGATSWSGAARYGGIRWGTNFTTRPEFLTMPLISMSGEADVPSTVDLYVNDALRLREKVPSGPFSIEDIPTITGAGEVRMVVRDIFGREQLISRNFYGSSRLLRAGLDEWSIDVGAVREQYGTASDNYGNGMIAATWRRGLSDRLTIEGHTQATADHRMGGLGVDWLLPFQGTMSASAATSRSTFGSGSLARLGFQRQGQRFNIGIESQVAADTFQRLGMTTGSPVPTRQHRAHFGIGGHVAGSLSAAYIAQHYPDNEDIELVTLSFSRNLGRWAHLGLSILHFVDSHDSSLQAALNVPLGFNGPSASIIGHHRVSQAGNDSRSGAVQISRNAPAGSGFGYRLRSGLGDDDLHQGMIDYQSTLGAWSLEGSRDDQTTAVRATARGGVVLMDRHLLPGRFVDDGFAVVDVGGFEDVRIYADNQEVARSNHDGVALVPRLRSYERNRIRIEQADFPLGATLGELEQIASPRYRSGMILRFKSQKTRNALARLVRENGEVVPVGAVATDQDGKRYPVGLNGEIFMTDVADVSVLSVEWNGASCSAVLELSPSMEGPYAEPGDIACKD